MCTMGYANLPSLKINKCGITQMLIHYSSYLS